MDNSTLKQSGHQNDIILGSKSSSVMLNSDMCKNYNKGNNNIEVIV